MNFKRGSAFDAAIFLYFFGCAQTEPSIIIMLFVLIRVWFLFNNECSGCW